MCGARLVSGAGSRHVGVVTVTGPFLPIRVQLVAPLGDMTCPHARYDLRGDGSLLVEKGSEASSYIERYAPETWKAVMWAGDGRTVVNPTL